MAAALRCRRDWRGEPVLHDCKQCRDNPKLRMAWGCESETEEVQVGIPCQEREGGSRGSQACDPHGVEAIHRCPLSLLWPETIALLRLYAHWPDRLVLAGGLHDQPAVYLEAMEFLDRAVGELKDAERQDQEAMRSLTHARRNA